MALTDVIPATSVHALRAKTPSLISEHGLIGDLQTAALVATDGTIDWFCCPRFDSPSVFARILDRQRGGWFRIAPVNHDECVVKQLYFPDTALLITRFMSETGVAELVDFMPIPRDPKVVTDNHRIVRIVRGIRGDMQLPVDCAPRFDYGRAEHSVEVTEHGAVLEGAGVKLTLHGMPGLERQDNDLSATRTVHANETFGVVLESGSATPPRPYSYEELWQLLENTAQFWRDWIGRSTYRGRWRERTRRRERSSRRPPRRCRSNWVASATGIIALPGSATRPTPWARCWRWATWRKRSRLWSGCATGSNNTSAPRPGH
jgi:GH15 family glucan-1,4-alpha-glucosidase